MPTGRYAQHWHDYRAASSRRTLRLLGVVLLLPLLALGGYALARVTEWAMPILMVLLAGWLACFTCLALAASRVTCPRCATVYTRGKFLCDCPACGLRMLQEDP